MGVCNVLQMFVKQDAVPAADTYCWYLRTIRCARMWLSLQSNKLINYEFDLLVCLRLYLITLLSKSKKYSRQQLLYFVCIMSAGPANITHTKYTNCCTYSTSWWWANKCLKHVQAVNCNKLKANSATCWYCCTGSYCTGYHCIGSYCTGPYCTGSRSYGISIFLNMNRRMFIAVWTTALTDREVYVSNVKVTLQYNDSIVQFILRVVYDKVLSLCGRC
jgi:hypothetical protein